MMHLPLVRHMMFMDFHGHHCCPPSVTRCVDPLGLTRTMAHGWLSACMQLSLIETYLPC